MAKIRYHIADRVEDNRTALRCGKTDVELVAIKLRLDACGRLRAEIEWK